MKNEIPNIFPIQQILDERYTFIEHKRLPNNDFPTGKAIETGEMFFHDEEYGEDLKITYVELPTSPTPFTPDNPSPHWLFLVHCKDKPTGFHHHIFTTVKETKDFSERTIAKLLNETLPSMK